MTDPTVQAAPIAPIAAAAPLAAAADDAPAAGAAPAPAAPAAPATVVDFDQGGVWGSETIALAYPFKAQGVTYSCMTMRIPSGNDLANWAANNFDRVGLAAALTGLDPFVLKIMRAEDFRKIMKWVASFLD